MSFTEHFRQAAAASGYKLSEEQIHKFEIYYQLLVEWNQKMNLTAITEPAEVAVKHMVDSLTAFEEQLFFSGASVADVGTGAGFPGVPLKLFRPDLQLTLIDSLQKRLNFLTAVIEAAGIKDVAVLHYRAEEAGQKKELREAFDFVTSRAVARLPVLCELCLPLVKIGGYFVALKGRRSPSSYSTRARVIPCRMAPAWPLLPPPATVTTTSSRLASCDNSRGWRTSIREVSRPK